MIDKSTLAKQIRQLEIKSNKIANEIFAGQYKSVFKGQGIEFAEVREYQIGDDFRNIDRNVTARHGKPYIKLFSEERELTIILLIDISASQNFGGADKLKSETVAEISAALAFSSLKNNDRIGMLSFTDRIEKVLPPKKGKNNILRIINEILTAKPAGTKTQILLALKALNEIWRRRAVVFLISDFQDENYERDLNITAKKHDLICIKVEDDRETDIPNIGLIGIKNPENPEEFLTIDASCVRKIFIEKRKEFNQKTNQIFKKARTDIIQINTKQPYINPLIKFFRERENRIRRWDF